MIPMLLMAPMVADSLVQELQTVEVHAKLHHEQHEALKSKDLAENLGVSLGELLAHEQGFSNRSMGAAAARPQFRGLGAARLVLSENGASVRDMSATAPDHALALSPSSADQLVHYTGAEAIARFATSTAGIVEMGEKQTIAPMPEGEWRSSANSNNLGLTNFLSYKFPWQKSQLSASALGQWDQNFHSPEGEVQSTDLQQYQFKTAYLQEIGPANIGAKFQVLSNDYGIPGGFVGGHAQGVRIQMQRQSAATQLSFPVLDHQKISLALEQSQYGHDELESGRISMQFRLDQYAIASTWGLYLERDTLELRFRAERIKQVFGGYVLSAPNQSLSLASSLLYKKQNSLGYLALGLSQSWRNYEMLKPNLGKNRDFLSGSASAELKFEMLGQPLLRYTEMSRIPEADELYNRGPHLAAWSYDQGNEELPIERGREWELHNDWVLPLGIDLSHSVYVRDYDAYLMMEATGKINTRNGSNLPIWQMKAVAAQFAGGEVKLDQKLGQCWNHSLAVETQLGRESDSHRPLPLMAPHRGTYHLEFSPKPWQYNMDLRGALAQDRLGAFEDRSPAYLLLDLGVAKKWNFLAWSLRTSLSVDNVLDQVWRNHLSRIKSVYPEKGREVKLNLQALF